MANVNFSQAIKTLKTERKMTDKDLAKQLDVSVNSIYNWSRGITSPTGNRRERLLEEMKRLSQGSKNSSVASNGNGKQEDIGKTKLRNSPKKYQSKKLSRTPRKARKLKENEPPAAVVDKNLLKTYYTQLAAEKKKRTFHIEIEGLKKTHSKEITAEQWAELMTMIEEI